MIILIFRCNKDVAYEADLSNGFNTVNAKPGGGPDSPPPFTPHPCPEPIPTRCKAGVPELQLQSNPLLPTHATNPSPSDARPVFRSYSFKPIYP